MIPPILITIVAAMLRFTALNWDAGARLHPDEALIVNGALSIKFFSQMFPGFHDYNGLSVYLLRGASVVAAQLLHSTYWSTTPEGVTLVGRFLSAFFATASVPATYVLAKRLWNARVGIIAGLLLACAPILIQLAHFYTTESLIVFLLLLLSHAVISYARMPNVRSLIRMSVHAGLLLATKNTAYLFLLIPMMILFGKKLSMQKTIRTFITFIAGTAIVFFMTSPYSFLDMSGYLTRSEYLADVVTGRLLMDWTMQFQQSSVFFWIPNLLYAFGPVVIFGIIAAVGYIRFSKNKLRFQPTAIFALWTLGYLLFLSFTYLKFIRYSAPLAPYLALFAAKLLWDVNKNTLGKIMVGIIILIQLTWAAMFFHIYSVPHTSVRAARWIAAHVPADTTILTETWNSILRFNRSPLTGKQFEFFSFNAYAPASKEKAQTLLRHLQSTDVIILESQKVKNTIYHLSDRYPYAAQFYRNLENGSLGFEKVAVFTSYPKFGPLEIHDESAEETWTVFDHPTITIYARHGVCTPQAICQY